MTCANVRCAHHDLIAKRWGHVNCPRRTRYNYNLMGQFISSSSHHQLDLTSQFFNQEAFFIPNYFKYQHNHHVFSRKLQHWLQVLHRHGFCDKNARNGWHWRGQAQGIRCSGSHRKTIHRYFLDKHFYPSSTSTALLTDTQSKAHLAEPLRALVDLLTRRVPLASSSLQREASVVLYRMPWAVPRTRATNLLPEILDCNEARTQKCGSTL